MSVVQQIQPKQVPKETTERFTLDEALKNHWLPEKLIEIVLELAQNKSIENKENTDTLRKIVPQRRNV